MERAIDALNRPLAENASLPVAFDESSEGLNFK